MYETETYDYPSAIQESISDLSTSIGYGITNFAATNLKGTAIPAPAAVTPPAAQHKTLPHALGRAATQATTGMQAVEGAGESKLGQAFGLYAGVWDKIGAARVEHDQAVKQGFLAPWQVTLTTSIAVAMKARQAVRVSRLELDAAKQRCVAWYTHGAINLTDTLVKSQHRPRGKSRRVLKSRTLKTTWFRRPKLPLPS